MKQGLFQSVKWLATLVLIVGSFVNSMGWYPVGPMILVSGGMLWLWVSIQMRDRPLIVTNAVMILAGGLPLLWQWLY